MGRRVLIVGSGGREHALALRLLDSASVSEVVVTPGNAGTRKPPHDSSKALSNASGEPFEVALELRPDLVVIGPEAPLCDGLADALTDSGIVTYGPSREGARLEGSKAFMKELATQQGILTAKHATVRSVAAAREHIARASAPPVVKADGLCGGKGVVVPSTKDEALEAAESMLQGGRFGDAGATVVLEERIEGAEASLHAICDGKRAFLLPAAQDHKRIGDGDTGPNTGGMGAYAPAPLVTPALFEHAEKEVVQRVLDGMAARGTPFRGTLFAGLMITPRREAYVLEFNVRFGDPETQVLMSLLEGDFGDALDAAARGELDPDALSVRAAHSMCIVLAAHGYPGSVRTGDPIEGIAEAEAVEGVRVLHAGTRLEGERLVTAGGRVLGVTATGPTLEAAHRRAYEAAGLIRFEGKQQRSDIGARAFGAQ